MQTIKVINAPYEIAKAYKPLADLEFVDYRELPSTEAAIRLHEGEADVALIPVAEFVAHGEYVGLDFGYGCQAATNKFMLYSHSPIQDLERIYLYDEASSSSLLLRLLLSDHWNVAPRLMRRRLDVSPEDLGPRDGILVFQDKPSTKYEVCKFGIDIVNVWSSITGLPFVFMVWAARPGTLTLTEHQVFNDLFHRHTAHLLPEKELVTAERDFSLSVDEPYEFYYLNNFVRKGMNRFITRAAKKGFVPPTRYRYATFTLLDRQTAGSLKERSVDTLLSDSISGSRLSVYEATKLANNASLADLGLAADLLRNKLFSKRSVGFVIPCRTDFFTNTDRSIEVINRAIKSGVSQIFLVPDSDSLLDLSEYEEILNILSTQFPISIEGFNVAQLVKLSEKTGIAAQDVLSRLVTAGLDSIHNSGGGLLIDRIMRSKGITNITSEDWLRMMKWIHRFGGASSCYLSIDKDNTWEERLIHLHKLRMLQDETRGFRYFYCDIREKQTGQIPAELKLRTTIISRLFLDNVPSIQENALSNNSIPGVLSLCFGANEVRIPVGEDQIGDTKELLSTLHSLKDMGLDFDFERLEIPTVTDIQH